MADRDDAMDARDLERAAAETREDAEARRVRSEDLRETRRWQEGVERELRDAARAARDNDERLRAGVDGGEPDLRRTGELARELRERAESLREETHDVAEAVRRVEITRPDESA